MSTMRTAISPSLEEHLRQVEEWLDANVTVFRDVATVRMHSFAIDWEELKGAFSVSIDGIDYDEPLRFSCLTVTGKPEIYLPMFHSPLGAPASYAAVELPKEVHERLVLTLQELLPSVKPLGLDKETGEILTFQDPPSKRLSSQEEIWSARRKLSQPGFAITLRL